MKINKALISISISFLMGFLILVVASPVTNAASFSKYIRSHNWYRLTDGSQGGYNDKTKFSNRTIKYTTPYEGKTRIKFYTLKKVNKTTYYGKGNYKNKMTKNPGNKKYWFKIKQVSKDTIWLVPKHHIHVSGNYKGNSQYGAVIFSLHHQ
ncbi:hypothetical protein MOO44_03110 [Nicoliella spurrieriana]|uniref:Uncharacterized protein n=1 Tax=Nicoliella spurrieriana TaxID=2925830 RepID=A0A976X648_9LACO|nr:hypothetical protein [Nicoliella spurrieriana]UQS87167.1 hypothetical protein MOO44_03110 [Nicoliella spurrieriana]